MLVHVILLFAERDFVQKIDSRVRESDKLCAKFDF